MANYMSSPADYGKTIDTSALDLGIKVAELKKQQYDANFAQTQEILNQYGNVDLLREDTKQYLAERLQKITDTVNNAKNRDYSRSNVARSIQSQISTALDDNVLNHIAQTQKYRKYEQEVATLKSKNPKIYSDLNYSYGLSKAGLQDYLSGQTDRMGEFKYIPYTDVSEKLIDFSKNLDKYADVVKEQTADGLYWVNTEGKRLTESDIYNKVSNLLSPEDRQQIQINGWANYQNNVSQQGQIENYNRYKENVISKLDSKLKALEAQKEGAPEQEKMTLQMEIDSYNSYKKNRIDAMDKNIKNGSFDTMSSEMEYENTIGSFSRAFAFDNVSRTYDANDVAVEQMKLQFKALTSKEKTSKDTNQDGIEDIRQVDLGHITEDRNFLTEEEKKATEFSNSAQQKVNTLYDSLPATIRDHYEDVTKGWKQEDKDEYKFDFVKRLAQDNNKYVNKGTIAQIEGERNRANTHMKNYTESIKKSTEVIESEALPAMVEEYSGILNSNIKILDTKGRAVSGRDYLEANNIKTVKDLETPQGKIVKDQMLKSYYADRLLSTNKTTNKEQYSFLETALKSKFNTTQEYNQFLQNARDKGVFNTAPSLSIGIGFQRVDIGLDNSAEEDARLKNLITTDKIKAKASDLIKEGIILPSEVGLEISSGTQQHKDLMNAVSSEFRAGESSFIADKNTDISIKILSPEVVQVTQARKPTKENPSKFETATITIKNLPDSIKNKIDFSGASTIYNNKTAPNIQTPTKFFSTSDTRLIKDLADNFTGSREEAFSYTTEGALSNLFNPAVQSAVGTEKEPTEMGRLVKSILINERGKAPLYVATENEDGEVYVSVKYKKGNLEQTVYKFTDPIPENQLDSVYREVSYMPQKYVIATLQKMVQDELYFPNKTNTIFETLNSVYGSR